jgi:hypothetical protein
MEVVNVLAMLGAALAAVFAFLTVREARRSRLEDAVERRLQRLERLAQLVGELGERVGDASTRSGTLCFALAVFTQRKLFAALAAIPEDEFALPECRALVEYLVDPASRERIQSVYDGTKAALVELASVTAAVTAPAPTPRPNVLIRARGAKRLNARRTRETPAPEPLPVTSRQPPPPV